MNESFYEQISLPRELLNALSLRAESLESFAAHLGTRTTDERIFVYNRHMWAVLELPRNGPSANTCLTSIKKMSTREICLPKSY